MLPSQTCMEFQLLLCIQIHVTFTHTQIHSSAYSLCACTDSGKRYTYPLRVRPMLILSLPLQQTNILSHSFQNETNNTNYYYCKAPCPSLKKQKKTCIMAKREEWNKQNKIGGHHVRQHFLRKLVVMENFSSVLKNLLYFYCPHGTLWRSVNGTVFYVITTRRQSISICLVLIALALSITFQGHGMSFK